MICITGERYNKRFKETIRSLLLKYKPEKVLVGDCSGVDTSAKEVCIEVTIEKI
jgi:hypothetical protein